MSLNCSFVILLLAKPKMVKCCGRRRKLSSFKSPDPTVSGVELPENAGRMMQTREWRFNLNCSIFCAIIKICQCIDAVGSEPIRQCYQVDLRYATLHRIEERGKEGHLSIKPHQRLPAFLFDLSTM
jgi:hypothetical protein